VFQIFPTTYSAWRVVANSVPMLVLMTCRSYMCE